MNRLHVAAVLAGLCLGATASAQSANAPTLTVSAITTDSVAPRAPQVSTLDRPSDAVRRPAVIPDTPMPASSQNMGEAKAEMIVGGAAFVAGALMDNDAGTILMLGGAVVGLYGLWNYLK